MNRWWAKLLLVVGVCVALSCVVASVFCIRSRSSVEAYKDQLRAAGEILDVKALVPPRPDPASNGVTFFDNASGFLNSGAGIFESNSPSSMRMVAVGRAAAGWQEEEVVSI